ncbi:MAG TPA: TlpA disulfide reductase family protein [Eudoraea sp.]|nr:TlpA disulfide reductase family protein [Eudoraea sp.]
MKKYVYIFLTLVILASCGTGTDGFTVNGDLRGDLENGTQVFLRKASEQGRPMEVDTATIEDGKFTFSGSTNAPELHYIFIDQLAGHIPVVIEEGTIEVNAEKDSLVFAEITGTLQNDLFSNFLESTRALSMRARSMSDDMRMAQAEVDSMTRVSTIAALRDEYAELEEEAKKFELDFAREHPEALISALIIERELTMGTLPQIELQEMFEALSPEIKKTTVGERIKEKLSKKDSTSIGSKAPNFSAPTPSGEELSLHEVLGKATILDFWAAWCKPCRAENPNVVKVYEKYHGKGLSILGVSLDRRAEDWKKAIEDDGLVWNHVSNVQYFDEIAKLYNVNAIPATFILDENGIIVAKNLRGSALEDKISEMLQ